MKDAFLYALVGVGILLMLLTYKTLRKRYPTLTKIPDDGIDIPDSYAYPVNTFVFEGSSLEVHSFEELRILLNKAGFLVRVEEPFMLVAHVFYKVDGGKYAPEILKYEVPAELRNSLALHEYNVCRVMVCACQAYKAEYGHKYQQLQDIDFL